MIKSMQRAAHSDRMSHASRRTRTAIGFIVGGVLAGAAVSVAISAPSQTVSIAADTPEVNALPRVEYFEPGVAEYWGPRMSFVNSYGKVTVLTHDMPAFNTKDHPFFQPIGTNGRACITCHQPANAMSISVDTIRQRWSQTQGKDPLFEPIDGSNCPNMPQEKEQSHSLLLDKGLFRISLPWPPRNADGTVIDPEFDIEVIADPTGCNSGSVYGLKVKDPHVSVYRRPRPAANLRFVDSPFIAGGVSGSIRVNGKTGMPLDRDPETGEYSSMSMMSDGRATSLKAQMEDAMHTHLGMSEKYSPEKLSRILDFEERIYVAMDESRVGGNLNEPHHPPGLGVDAVASGKDHLQGGDYDSEIFLPFDAWKAGGADTGATVEERTFRASVARGNDLFTRRAFWIGDTYGINNLPNLGNPFKNTCIFCHNQQLTGQDLVPGWMGLGTANLPHAVSQPDMPLFKITCKADVAPHPFLGRVIYTHDPGRALISGKCQDVGAVIMQGFRGISARAPYFANGSAASLREIIDFYDRRFNIGFSEQDKTDLVNYLSVL